MPETIYPSRRSPVMGRGGMVASSQPLATAAGLEGLLFQDGNAADAAVATAAALNVTEPTSTGLGGDMFALFYDFRTGKVTALNGSGRAPATLSLERMNREGFGVGTFQGATLKELPPYHPYTITVPGACAGWCDLLERHGTFTLEQVLSPAIRLAENGYPVATVTAHFWERAASRQLKDALKWYGINDIGSRPASGVKIFHNPGLVKTFREIAAGGMNAFYGGKIADAIVSTIRHAGGCLEMEDLAGHSSTWEAPISAEYSGLRLWECPPNGQGLTALLALKLLAGFELPPDPLSPDRLHLEIEALRLAFADTRWYVADPATENIPLHELLSREYATERRRLIDPKLATLDQVRGSPVAGSDTVYFCTMDRWGNACSFINSNYMGFGTGIVPSGWGSSLQNRGHNFNLEPGHPNVLAPGKRPYHTIIPAMITRVAPGEPETLFGPLGVMGGFMQPQGHLQVFLALAQGMDPQVALEMPRFCISDGTSGGVVALEEGIPTATVNDLRERGHPVEVVSGWGRALFGRGQVILRDPGSGLLVGGSDPRADGCAMTLIT